MLQGDPAWLGGCLGHTGSNSLNGGLNVSISLFQGEYEIDVGPVGEDVPHHAELCSVLLLHVAEFSLFVERLLDLHRGAICGSVGCSGASSGITSSTSSGGAPAP